MCRLPTGFEETFLRGFFQAAADLYVACMLGPYGPRAHVLVSSLLMEGMNLFPEGPRRAWCSPAGGQ